MSEPTVFDPREHKITYEEAELQGARRILLILLPKRLGSMPRDLEQAIEACASRETLELLAGLVAEETDPKRLQAKARSLLA